MFPAIPGGSFIIAQGRADAGNLIGGHAGPDASAIDHDAASDGARSDQLADLERQVGIVGGLFLIDAHVEMCIRDSSPIARLAARL